jgi:DNA repair exonuclease SbcCD ATPase subunit
VFVKFKKIIVSNFLSITSQIELNYNSGLTLVQGFNKDKNSRNGVGKSALILDSIFWVLFGEAFRRIKQSEIRNRKGGSTCVKLYFSIGEDEYELTRRIPTSITFIKNGQDITKSVDETNKEICQIIHCNEKFARNSIFLDTKTNSFLSETPINRQKFLESIFDLTVLRDMLEAARLDKNKLQKEIDIDYSSLQEKKNGKKRLEDVLKNEEEKFSILIEQLNKDKKNIELKISKYDTSILEKSLDIIKENTSNLKQLEEVKQKISNQLIGLKKELELLKSSNVYKTPNICPTCKQSWNSADMTHKVEYEEKIKNLINKISKREDRHIQIIYIENDLKKSILENNNIVEQMKNGLDPLYEKIKEINIKLNQKLDNNSLILEISKYDEEIKNLSTLLDEKLFQMDIQLNAIQLLGDKGIKSIIIPKILDKFNYILANYANVFNFPYSIKVENNFDVVIFQKEKEISYGSLSGGEAKRIDVSILLALQDIKKIVTGFDCNLFVCDELLDSSIDEVGIVSILELLRERAIENNHCVFFITHRESVSFSFDKIIHLEKIDRETVLVNA